MVRLTDRPDMTLDVYRGRKTTTTTQLLYLYILYLQKPAEEKYPVGPWLLALFIFVVCGSGKGIFYVFCLCRSCFRVNVYIMLVITGFEINST